MDEAARIDPRESLLSGNSAQRLYARLAEHARAAGGGCTTCGPGPCVTRADAIGQLAAAGLPLDPTAPEETP